MEMCVGQDWESEHVVNNSRHRRGRHLPLVLKGVDSGSYVMKHDIPTRGTERRGELRHQGLVTVVGGQEFMGLKYPKRARRDRVSCVGAPVEEPE
jgi:hypothetical protein